MNLLKNRLDLDNNIEELYFNSYILDLNSVLNC